MAFMYSWLVSIVCWSWLWLMVDCWTILHWFSIVCWSLIYERWLIVEHIDGCIVMDRHYYGIILSISNLLFWLLLSHCISVNISIQWLSYFIVTIYSHRFCLGTSRRHCLPWSVWSGCGWSRCGGGGAVWEDMIVCLSWCRYTL